jgi:hypothetical protein
MTYDHVKFTNDVRGMVANGDRVPKQRTAPVGGETLAMIAELKAAHPVESCDLFRTTTGQCTCPVGKNDETAPAQPGG